MNKQFIYYLLFKVVDVDMDAVADELVFVFVVASKASVNVVFVSIVVFLLFFT